MENIPQMYYFEIAFYMGRTPMNLPVIGRTFSVKLFGYTIALNVRTEPKQHQESQQQETCRTSSSCPCVPEASCCTSPCNRGVCKVDTSTPQTEIQSVQEDRTDTDSDNHTTPSQDTENTAERQESTASSSE